MIQVLAETVEGVVHSPGREAGYGAGESLVHAHRLRPELIEPLAEALSRFEPSDYLARHDDVKFNLDALAARKALFGAIREILNQAPKNGPGEQTGRDS
jgi:hypothetical protein